MQIEAGRDHGTADNTGLRPHRRVLDTPDRGQGGIELRLQMAFGVMEHEREGTPLHGAAYRSCQHPIAEAMYRPAPDRGRVPRTPHRIGPRGVGPSGTHGGRVMTAW